MPITYDVTNNIITVTGYTEAVPCTFLDLWNADKAGTLSLHVRTGITGVDAAPVNLTRNARPADEVLLGGPKNDLYIIVTNWTNMTSATIRLIGTDAAGNAQTEDIPITGNGTYNATKLFKTLTQSQVTAFTKSDSGSFKYEIQQGQWGVVCKQGNSTFLFKTRLLIGDGSTSTFFVDSLKTVIWLDGSISASAQYVLQAKANATATFGILIDAANKTTRSGCTFVTEETTYLKSNLGAAGSNGAVNFYSCTFKAASKRLNVQPNSRMWNCLCVGYCPVIGQTSTTDFYNITICGAGWMADGFESSLGVYNALRIMGVGAAVYVWDDSSVFDIHDFYARNNDYDFAIGWTPFTKDWNIINADCGWTVSFQQAGQTGRIMRQYTVDIQVTDKNATALQNATVMLKDKDGNTVFSVSTVADGTITQQTVSRGYYNRANGNALQEYSPHTLTISKVGYQTYTKKFTLSEPINWRIALNKATQVFSDLGRPVLNLKREDPENVNVISL